jgi:protein ImuB
MRIAAAALLSLRIDLARALVPQGPLAIVVARPGGAVQKDTDLLGNTKLDEVSSDARARGVRAGQTVAAARAKCAELSVRVVAMDAVNDALARVAEAALAFGATTGFDAASDVVFVDTTGCAHLYGGEKELARALAVRVCAMGHACRVAVAEGPRIAAAIARFARGDRDAAIAIAPGQDAEAIRSLPTFALPLDDETIRWLGDVGVRTIGALQALPKKSLGVRLGARAHEIMQLVRGDDRAPLVPYRPPPVPEERVDLEYGVETTEGLVFVLKTLADRMAARLTGRGMGAVRLEIVLSLDRALTHEEPRDEVAVVLPSPIARASDLLSVLRTRIERHALRAPALAVTLRAPELARAAGRALDLFEAVPKAETTLPRLLAELAAEIGESNVGVLEVRDTWIPEERSRLVPCRASAAPPPFASWSAPEPSRWLSSPRAVTTAELARESPSRRVARLEAVEWWRRGLVAREIAATWLEVDGAIAWIEIDRAAGTQRVQAFFD